MAVVGFGTKLLGVLGPAKWAAIVILSGFSGAGLTYALMTRGTEPVRVERPVATVAVELPSAGLNAADADLTRFMPRSRPKGPEAPAPDTKPGKSQGLAEATPVEPQPAPVVVPKVDEQPPRGVTPPPAPAAQPAVSLKKLNLNTATQAELELLPGVGPKTAQAILEFRKVNGKFRTVTDLDKIKGIGPKTLQKLAPLVCVD